MYVYVSGNTGMREKRAAQFDVENKRILLRRRM